METDIELYHPRTRTSAKFCAGTIIPRLIYANYLVTTGGYLVTWTPERVATAALTLAGPRVLVRPLYEMKANTLPVRHVTENDGHLQVTWASQCDIIISLIDIPSGETLPGWPKATGMIDNQFGERFTHVTNLTRDVFMVITRCADGGNERYFDIGPGGDDAWSVIHSGGFQFNEASYCVGVSRKCIDAVCFIYENVMALAIERMVLHTPTGFRTPLAMIGERIIDTDGNWITVDTQSHQLASGELTCTELVAHDHKCYIYCNGDGDYILYTPNEPDAVIARPPDGVAVILSIPLEPGFVKKHHKFTDLNILVSY